MDTNCTRLEDWLADRPDVAELPAEWREHVGECGPCAQYWRDERRLVSAIVAWRSNPPLPPNPSELIITLLAEVAVKPNATRPMRTAGQRSWWPMLAASAALALFGIGLARSLPTQTTIPYANTGETKKIDQQLALTSTVGALLSRFEGTSHDVMNAGQNALPRFPGFQQDTAASPFEAANVIDPEAPSEVLRYGRPLGQGVGQAFQFLQIAVPIPTTDAG